MPETITDNTNDAVLDDEQEEVETYDVQWGMKWVNFTTQVKAKDEEEAVELAWKAYKENGHAQTTTFLLRWFPDQ